MTHVTSQLAVEIITKLSHMHHNELINDGNERSVYFDLLLVVYLVFKVNKNQEEQLVSLAD